MLTQLDYINMLQKRTVPLATNSLNELFFDNIDKNHFWLVVEKKMENTFIEEFATISSVNAEKILNYQSNACFQFDFFEMLLQYQNLAKVKPTPSKRLEELLNKLCDGNLQSLSYDSPNYNLAHRINSELRDFDKHGGMYGEEFRLYLAHEMHKHFEFFKPVIQSYLDVFNKNNLMYNASFTENDEVIIKLMLNNGITESECDFSNCLKGDDFFDIHLG